MPRILIPQKSEIKMVSSKFPIVKEITRNPPQGKNPSRTPHPFLQRAIVLRFLLTPQMTILCMQRPTLSASPPPPLSLIPSAPPPNLAPLTLSWKPQRMPARSQMGKKKK